MARIPVSPTGENGTEPWGGGPFERLAIRVAVTGPGDCAVGPDEHSAEFTVVSR